MLMLLLHNKQNSRVLERTFVYPHYLPDKSKESIATVISRGEHLQHNFVFMLK